MTTSQVLDLTRSLGTFACTLNVIVWIWYARKHPRLWGFSAAVLLWVVNILLFNTTHYFANIENVTYNFWSTAIRLQALICVLGIGIWMILDEHK